MIGDGYKQNFVTLQRAFANEDVCLMDCMDAQTGKPVIAICAVSRQAEEVLFTPLAKMFDGNPFEELLPSA